jgi:hypothetical protein
MHKLSLFVLQRNRVEIYKWIITFLLALPGLILLCRSGFLLLRVHCQCVEGFIFLCVGALLTVDLQARIVSITGKHETELAVLKERNTHLQRTVIRLEQDYALKQAALAGASVEMEQQEAVSECLIKVEAKRADAAEREAVDARQRVEEERRVNGELRKRIGVTEAQWRLVEEEGRKRVVDAEVAMEEQLVMLKEMVAELERINGELVEKGNTLKKRYETNDLVGPYFRYWLFVKQRLIRFVYKDGRRKGFR